MIDYSVETELRQYELLIPGAISRTYEQEQLIYSKEINKIIQELDCETQKTRIGELPQYVFCLFHTGLMLMVAHRVHI